MTKEQRFFIHMLSDHLNGRKTAAPEDLDWNQIADYAAKHEVSGLVYHQCRDLLPEPLEALLSQKNAAEVYFYINRRALLKQIFQSFSEAKIPFFTVKGLDVARFYPVPALRTMGDSDIVIRSDDKELAHSIMTTSLGFHNTRKDNIEWIYTKNGLVFELHDHLLYDLPFNSKAGLERADEAWAHARPTGEGSQYALDWSFHFLFLLLHVRKHLVDAGVGFRHFLDLAVTVRRCELDWDWLRRTLEELGMTQFVQICSALLDRWFGISLQVPPLALDDASLDALTETVFNNGVFGMSDERNKDHSEVNAIALRSGPRWLIRLRNLSRSIFPPYRDMRYVKSYAFLDGRPWLLPAAWIYRFYRSIRYRLGAKGRNLVSNAFIPDEKLDARLDELKKWGL